MEPKSLDFLLEPIEQALSQYLQPRPEPGAAGKAIKLLEAMRYAVLGGGKRLRPLLTCTTSLDLCGEYNYVLPTACAIEFIHAYSLIHDDLPCMDDDALRRGKPTCHIAFDEATAVLAGDALQALAFEVLARDSKLNPGTRLDLIKTIAGAAGAQGMVAGQSFDMCSTGSVIELPQLEQLHAGKTGALIAAAISAGAMAANADTGTRELLGQFGRKLGLAFQVIDDILDETQSSGILGKQAGADQIQGKNTFPRLMGLDAAKEYASKLEEDCNRLLAELNLEKGYLKALTHRLIHREY